MAAEFISLPCRDQPIDCYLTLPAKGGKVPALVMASSVFGVTEDLTEICAFFADANFLVAAPDLFWNGDKGPLPRTDEGQRRATDRAADRARATDAARAALEVSLSHVRSHPNCNGRTAILGFCFGGPFAASGIVDMGCDAGAAFHGSNFNEQLENLRKIRKPLELHWGDADFALPPDLRGQVEDACRTNANCNIVIYPGVSHGYTARTAAAFDRDASDHSRSLTLKMLERLRA